MIEAIISITAGPDADPIIDDVIGDNTTKAMTSAAALSRRTHDV